MMSRFFTSVIGYSSIVFFFWMTRVFGVDFIWAPKPLTAIHGYSVTINTENVPPI